MEFWILRDMFPSKFSSTGVLIFDFFFFYWFSSYISIWSIRPKTRFSTVRQRE